MSEQTEEPLSRTAASAAVSGLGWRFVLGVARTSVRAGALSQAAAAAAAITAQAGPDADARLLADIRGGKIILTVRNPSGRSLSEADASLVARVSSILAGLGLKPDPGVGAADGRSVQLLEIAIDALDIAAVLPFWRAALGYADEPWSDGTPGAIIDPDEQGPAVWFQQM